MELKKLEAFKVVAEMNHLTKAASALYLSQPALTKIIHTLEAELEVTLFERAGRNIYLTRAGELFYEHVTRALEEINIGTVQAKHQEEVENRTIFLNTVFSPVAKELPKKILDFHQRYPDSRFFLEYKYTSAILRDILNLSCDLGICGDMPETEKFSMFEKHLLFQEPVSLGVGMHHRLAGQSLIDPRELKNESFVIWNRSQVGTNKLLNELGERYGFEPQIELEGFNDYGSLSAVAMGKGVALIPESVKENNSGMVITIPLDTEEPLTRDIYLVHLKRKVLSPVAAQFKAFLLSSAGE